MRPVAGHIIGGSVHNFSTENRLNGYSLGQLLLAHDMIISIKHTVDWELIRQQKKIQINKYNNRKNSKIFDHDYKVGDKFILVNDAT